jgi:ferredoxin
VCTTCAARITEGTVHQPDAMGVKAELQAEGYALLCVAYPRSDLKVLAGQEDALYEAQFGQYQK